MAAADFSMFEDTFRWLGRKFVSRGLFQIELLLIDETGQHFTLKPDCRSHQEAASLIGLQKTGYSAWDELDPKEARAQAYDLKNWTRIARPLSPNRADCVATQNADKPNTSPPNTPTKA